MNENTDSIIIPKEKAIQILFCLENALYVDKHMSSEQRSKLINLSNNLSWDIPDVFGFDLHEGTIDINTMKYKEDGGEL